MGSLFGLPSSMIIQLLVSPCLELIT
ncbi:hypothetical protein Goshw_026823, partial [Gossypium schwendimanii]|nr:hypothetical protein [Gossypium schwendimanii]